MIIKRIFFKKENGIEGNFNDFKVVIIFNICRLDFEG